MTDVRLMAPEERRFVANSWVASYASSDLARLMTPIDVWGKNKGEGGREYREGQNRLVDQLLARSSVRIVEVDSIVAAWACLEGDVVHYVFVRRMYRALGYVRALLVDELQRPTVYTHRSRDVDPRRVPRGWRYDPWRAWIGGGECAA